MGLAGLLLLLTLTAPPAQGVALQAGDLVVIDTNAKALLRVDPVSGHRSTITSRAIGGGVPLRFPWGIVIDSDHRIRVADRNVRAILAVDPDTGNRSVASGGGVGRGPGLGLPGAVALVALVGWRARVGRRQRHMENAS